MEEDWGFAYRERFFAAPYITLCKPRDDAVRELEWALEHDARFIVMIPGPITTAVGSGRPGDPMFDDFWRLINDSGITLCYHSGETYYSKFMPAWGESDYMMSFQALLGSGAWFSGNALCRTQFANHLHNGLFLRFPNLRMASERLGFQSFISSKMKPLWPDPADLSGGSAGNIKVSRLGIAVEDELASRETAGNTQLIMGSDFPHVEALRSRDLHQGPGASTTPPSSAEACDNGLQSCSPQTKTFAVNVSKSNSAPSCRRLGRGELVVSWLARSNLPDEIDRERDVDFLTALGRTAIRWTKSRS